MSRKKKTRSDFSQITPEIQKYTALSLENGTIDSQLYSKYKVNRGLRDLDGNGVLTGLTEISEIVSKTTKDGVEIPCKGKLYYRGYDIQDLVNGFISENRFGFEEITYLLLFGCLPSQSELDDFNEVLGSYRSLPDSFTRDVIMKAPSADMMNSISRSILTMFSYDTCPNDTSVANVLRQSLALIAQLPMIAVYSYIAYNYYVKKASSFHIHEPKPEYSTAQNILHMLRIDSKFSPLEAKLLDLALVLHAEHGGGNNSTFTTHVVTSSGTDTYSAISAALCSLKGPKHGGANIKAVQMFADLKQNISDWKDQDAVKAYLDKIVNKEAFDKTGLVYGVGHAVYSLSDPRAEVFKKYVKELSKEKGLSAEFELYSLVEKLAPEVIAKNRKIYKGVSANIDFYSGFVYEMLGLPSELFTPLFAIARISGWSAHRIEEIVNAGKIIRPSYKSVQPRQSYIPVCNR